MRDGGTNHHLFSRKKTMVNSSPVSDRTRTWHVKHWCNDLPFTHVFQTLYQRAPVALSPQQIKTGGTEIGRNPWLLFLSVGWIKDTWLAKSCSGTWVSRLNQSSQPWSNIFQQPCWIYTLDPKDHGISGPPFSVGFQSSSSPTSVKYLLERIGPHNVFPKETN